MVTAGFDSWRDSHVLGNPIVAAVEPQRLTELGVAYCIDWSRRRLTAVGEGIESGSCLHDARLTVWCSECSADLDVLAADMLP